MNDESRQSADSNGLEVDSALDDSTAFSPSLSTASGLTSNTAGQTSSTSTSLSPIPTSNSGLPRTPGWQNATPFDSNGGQDIHLNGPHASFTATQDGLRVHDLFGGNNNLSAYQTDWGQRALEYGSFDLDPSNANMWEHLAVSKVPSLRVARDIWFSYSSPAQEGDNFVRCHADDFVKLITTCNVRHPVIYKESSPETGILNIQGISELLLDGFPGSRVRALSISEEELGEMQISDLVCGIFNTDKAITAVDIPTTFNASIRPFAVPPCWRVCHETFWSVLSTLGCSTQRT